MCGGRPTGQKDASSTKTPTATGHHVTTTATTNDAMADPPVEEKDATAAAPSAPMFQALFDGPIDVIGDIHGECGTLCELLDRLGYDGNGEHPDGRRLVFVGDLIDRGPDSPGVVRLVRHLMSRGKAQCIVGNHELNIMRGDRKHGNGWFYGDPEVIRKVRLHILCVLLRGHLYRDQSAILCL